MILLALATLACAPVELTQAPRTIECVWAGTYTSNRGRLEIDPLRGFLFSTSLSCLGPLVQEWGRVTECGDRLLLERDSQSAVPGRYLLDDDLLIICWGERRYLLERDEVKSFCNEFNAGLEPRRELSFSAFLHTADVGCSAEGRPQLPAEFLPLLFDQPLRAAVIGVGETHLERRGNLELWNTEVVLDVGRSQGAWLGMELWPGISALDCLTIVELEESHSIAVQRCIGKRKPAPEIGEVISTDPRRGSRR